MNKTFVDQFFEIIKFNYILKGFFSFSQLLKLYDFLKFQLNFSRELATVQLYQYLF
ncbi:hypothetical protein DespoDRAFT_03051 [Desulfobacter postgatei 2ac9]|uniref:Uncharacterized protein n=1 Tax=Desulfobacter postgatei 2ac9 TaxID=879212 RepID=I5B5U7_9BACT|nr:hypothetical protein DespoDRAFT_03051 [Desulfobacter postgatei 2ac9]